MRAIAGALQVSYRWCILASARVRAMFNIRATSENRHELIPMDNGGLKMGRKGVILAFAAGVP